LPVLRASFPFFRKDGQSPAHGEKGFGVKLQPLLCAEFHTWRLPSQFLGYFFDVAGLHRVAKKRHIRN
jgi:hypothetical protein